MNSEFIGYREVYTTVVGYDDGVYNLELYQEPGDVGISVEISENDAERICEFFEEDLPNPQPTKPIQLK